MSVIDGLHRWTGGLIGLLLVVLGLSGLALVHKDAWLRVVAPHAADPLTVDAGATARSLDAIFSHSEATSVTLATRDLGVHRVAYGKTEAGAYFDQTGAEVLSWTGKWARPEVWIFDLHHYLLIGDAGKTVAGLAGLVGLGFVITGAILWWRTRRSFELRLWPRAWTRFGVLRHHRDLEILAAPLLLVTFTTGVMMTLKPVETAVLSLLSPPAEMAQAAWTPKVHGGDLDRSRLDWDAMLTRAGERFPGAEPRVVTLPSAPSGLIALRVRQAGEPTPNGRTFLWFDPATAELVGVRDARAMPLGSRAAAYEYPVHSGKIGGWAWRALITVSGIALTVLGGFAVYVFWLNRLKPRQRSKTRGARPARASGRA